MTYYLEQSEWYRSIIVPEGMNLDMLNEPGRLDILLKPGIDLVEKDKIFIDLGCGTGLLGMHALEKGAKFVYFVERDKQMAKIIKEILPTKIDATKFKIINKDVESLVSSDFDYGDPEVVVSEFYGPRMFDEGYVNYTKHIKSMFPNCMFIPETFKGEFSVVDINYSDPIWPKDANLIDYFKMMYRDKAFANWFGFENHRHIGDIVFDADNQTFKNSVKFNFDSKEHKMICGVMTAEHQGLRQYRVTIGWILGPSDYNKQFEIYFDVNEFFNPRIKEIQS